MKEKLIAICQYKEWYGDENHVGDPEFGRHKMKGSQEFVFECDYNHLYNNEEEVIRKFNERYDRSDRFFRYEMMEIQPYFAPWSADFDPESLELTFKGEAL